MHLFTTGYSLCYPFPLKFSFFTQEVVLCGMGMSNLSATKYLLHEKSMPIVVGCCMDDSL